MIPYNHTWPYEKMMGDYYVSACPSCEAEHILLPLKAKDVKEIQTGKKHWLVMPCCNHRFYVMDMDDDYLLADIPLRRK
ncbi:hypothetical protein [Marinicrinis sediminis]|uniref:Uncharacterized protein n=1 Tax=Marinicrinis sediminis TaxID=1652465 RepID=A0ABW5REU8_9BACL